LPTASLAEVMAFYRRIAGSEAMPRRADLSPGDLPRAALPFVFLAETPDGTVDSLQYRLVGTGLTEKMGRDTTGMRLCDAYLGPDWAQLRPQYQYVLTAGRPLLARADFIGTDDRVYHYARLLMPLSDDGVAVSYCLGYVEFAEGPAD